MASNESWKKIFDDYGILNHDFDGSCFFLSAAQIKQSCQDFKGTSDKEVRILCKQDSRESRPDVFKENGLFILPVTNGKYAIVKGEGYVDIPQIKSEVNVYKSKLDFRLDSSEVGDSEMQHLDFAYASSLIRTFMEDQSLLLTIRGKKFTPKFSFNVNGHLICVSSVQTEVDAGYEGRDKIVLVEAKNTNVENTIIRQLYYPFKQWKTCTKKDVIPLFFERDKSNSTYNIWQYNFDDENDYNSIRLVRSGSYQIEGPNSEA
ncbi:type II restriction enzyme [Fibrobacter sp.]|uniref:type II restriction enzyme n=1 Tax=Fibrobacter sp. TaxID=35828 RepID=UPI00386752FA